ncbi:MAG TPA: VC0807 family protein [Acidimicrobiales bacterium]|nr:VC0807 family protein [Acidimicrobiales bacterium]
MIGTARGALPDSVYCSPTKTRVLGAVGRRLLPHLVEATVIPTFLFYVAFVTRGTVTAYVVALLWTYLAIVRRMVVRRPVPVIVVLACIGITARTLFALASGSTFVYFFQPVAGKIVLSLVFWASIATGTPLVARFAHDFCSIAPDVESRPAIVQLYRRLTHLWAGVNLVIAGLGLLLLLTVPVSTFIAVKSFMAMALTAAAVALTVAASVRVARREGVFASVSSNGTLMARAEHALVVV